MVQTGFLGTIILWSQSEVSQRFVLWEAFFFWGGGVVRNRRKLHKYKAKDNRSEVESVTLASLARCSNQLNWLASCKAIGNEIHGYIPFVSINKSLCKLVWEGFRHCHYQLCNIGHMPQPPWLCFNNSNKLILFFSIWQNSGKQRREDLWGAGLKRVDSKTYTLNP